jgi:hypothetical protein
MPWVKGEEYNITAENLIQVMDNNKIDKAVCCPNTVVGYKYSLANDYIAASMKKYPDRFYGFCRIDPRLILDPLATEKDPIIWKKIIENPDQERIQESWVFTEITRCIKELKFSGIKFHPVEEAFSPDNPIFEPIYELAIKLDVPIQIHCDRIYNFTANPMRILNVALNFPDLKICAVHLYSREAIEFLSQVENTYIEISEVSKGRLIQEAIDSFGDDRVLFGSDYPYGDPNIILAILKELHLDESSTKKILSENALNLLK